MITRLVEEKMILCLFIKVLLRDSTLVSEAIEECLEPIRKIAMGNKPYLGQYIEQCVTILFRHPEKGRQAYNDFNKVNLLRNVIITLFIGKRIYYCWNSSRLHAKSIHSEHILVRQIIIFS